MQLIDSRAYYSITVYYKHSSTLKRTIMEFCLTRCRLTDKIAVGDNMKKEDLRITRTKKFLVNSLLQLLQERSFDKISVIEICDRAMVHRATFYKHFEDKYDLFAYGMDCIKDDALSKTEFSDAFENTGDMFLYLADKALSYMQHHKAEIKAIIQNNNNQTIAELTLAYIERSIKEILSRSKRLVSHKVPLVVLSNFFAGGFASLAVWWIDNDNLYPKEEILKYINILMQAKTLIG